MIFYSQRMKIEQMFYQWCEENGVARKPNSLVAFMQFKGWLDEEAIWRDLPLRLTLEGKDD